MPASSLDSPDTVHAQVYAAPVRDTQGFPHADADRCVQCGLCLPHCPTYRKTRDENESPRGRIALMRAMASDQLPLSKQLVSHLDRCLSCRNCESVCPAEVPYGRLIDGARSMIHARAPQSRGQRWAWGMTDWILARPGALTAATWFAYLYRRTGVQTLLRATGLLRLARLHQLDQALPTVPRPHTWQSYYTPRGNKQGDVCLFLGCIARVVDSTSLDAAITTLNRLGWGVHVPTGQVCCGALHQHNGRLEQAEHWMQTNMSAFENDLPIVNLASGCGATLCEYGQILATEPARAFSKRVVDYSSFANTLDWSHATFNSSALQVAVHEPCTLRNVVRGVEPVYSVLRRLPNVTVHALEGNAFCCGAAGTYFLTQAELANQLLEDKLDAITASDADIIVTSNIGCALHLAAGLRARNMDIRVVHPAALVQQRMT